MGQFLAGELASRYGTVLPIRRVASLPSQGRFILIGSLANPLVREYLSSRAIKNLVNRPEGYWLGVDRDTAVVIGAETVGTYYGLQSLRQLIQREEGMLRIPGIQVRDWPGMPFRGIKLYLPGPENIAFFTRFVRDFLALYKFNYIVLEINGAMRFDRHPELNAGWLDFCRDMRFTRRERSWGPGHQFQDSANADTADGEVLEKGEVADLVRFCREHHVEVIPEVPSLTHSYYLLSRHRELAEISGAEWPDTYCPLAPGVYPLLFDVLDECIEVMQPRMVHIGHDEWRMPVEVCPRCKGIDPGELFARDVNKIHDYLRKKNIRTVIYGDHLIEPLRGKRTQKIDNPGGRPYEIPGALSPDQIKRLIPKDILVFNWFWNDQAEGQGETNDISLSEWGFEQVYNNLEPGILNYERRSARRGVIGGAPSSWAATNELNFGKDLMFDFLGSAQLLWSARSTPLDRLSGIVQSLLPGIRRRLHPVSFPSDHDPVVPINLQPLLPEKEPSMIQFDQLRGGRIAAQNKVFELTPRGKAPVLTVDAGNLNTSPLRIGEDVSSVIFLHASARPARNAWAYSATWNFADTADLLGWYEVTYADEFMETIPIRYGINILEVGWGKGHLPKNLAYEAELVDCAPAGEERISFFAFEWINPRFGVPIKEIRLSGNPRLMKGTGKKGEPNAILLAAVSVVKKRPAATEGRVKIGE